MKWSLAKKYDMMVTTVAKCNGLSPSFSALINCIIIIIGLMGLITKFIALILLEALFTRHEYITYIFHYFSKRDRSINGHFNDN